MFPTRVLVLLLSLPFTEALNQDEFTPKLLVYSIQSGFSHVNFMGRVADTLAEAGMNTTLLLSQINTAVGTGVSKARVLPVSPSPAAVAHFFAPANDDSKNIYKGSSHDLRSMINFAPIFSKLFYLQCSHLIGQTELIEQLRAEKYDLMLTETFDFCGFGISRLIGAKSVAAVFSSSLGDYTAWHTGTPSPWSVVQGSYSGVVDRSIGSRLWNLLAVAADYRVNHKFAGAANQAFRELEGQDFPSVEEIVGGASLIITAGDPLLDLPRPTQRKIVDIGAIGIREPKPLEQEYKDILALRPRSVVFSMGSVAQSADMPEEFKHGLIEAFGRFPDVTFIWKYEKPEDADYLLKNVKNVVLRKWIPQNELLGDPRVVALITHGGKTSLNEVGAKGLPSIFIPIYGDQPRNAAIAEKLGFGIFLNKQDLGSADIVEAAIREVLEKDKYTVAAKRVASMIRNRPFSAKELLVKHVRFAAQFGNVKSLDQEGLDYPLYMYWNLDIVAIFISIFVSVIAGFVFVCRRVFCTSRTSKKVKKQ